MLAGKAASSHNHDDRYYTESEVNNLLNGKAPSSHTHDDRYFTESEVKNMLWNQCMTREYEADNLTLNTEAHTRTFNIAVSGYWVAGIVSVAVDNATNNGTLSSKVRVYGFWYNQTEAWVRVRNTDPANAKVIIKIKVLYWKDCR